MNTYNVLYISGLSDLNASCATSGLSDFWPFSLELSRVKSFTSNLSSQNVSSIRMIPCVHDRCMHLYGFCGGVGVAVEVRGVWEARVGV